MTCHIRILSLNHYDVTVIDLRAEERAAAVARGRPLALAGAIHRRAVALGRDMYIDPPTGYSVFTRLEMRWHIRILSLNQQEITDGLLGLHEPLPPPPAMLRQRLPPLPPRPRQRAQSDRAAAAERGGRRRRVGRGRERRGERRRGRSCSHQQRRGVRARMVVGMSLPYNCSTAAEGNTSSAHVLGRWWRMLIWLPSTEGGAHLLSQECATG